jgi:hypothetical protein
VKNLFSLHTNGVKTKDIIDNQEVSSTQQQQSLYRIVEYDAGAAAANDVADDEDVAVRRPP